MRDPFLWSFPIGRLFGILVRVHWVFPIVALGMIFRFTEREGAAPGVWADITTVVVLLFFVVLLHEFGHCLFAHWMNGEAREILIWPLGGLAAVDIPHTPRAHFWTAFGGPAINLVICFVAALVLAFAFEFSYQPPWNPFWPSLRGDATGILPLTAWDGSSAPTNNQVTLLFARLFFISWWLFLLNVVLVGFPLDGGRMLQALLWPRFGYRQSMTYAVYTGFGVTALLCLVSIGWNEVLLLLLAFYIFTACKMEMFNLEAGGEDSLFGYDFSQGYTSLERDASTEAPPPRPKAKKLNFIQRWLQNRATKKLKREIEQREADEKRMDELLEKIQRSGKESLTDEEQRFLKKVADRYRNRS